MEEIKWRFGAVGNVVGKHTDGDGNTYYGTKAFSRKRVEHIRF